MSLSIENFLQQIDGTDTNGGFGKSSPNKFQVSLTIPPIMSNMIKNKTTIISIINDIADATKNVLLYRIDSIVLPGISLETLQTNNLGIGPNIKQTFNSVMSDCDISFILDNKGLIESFFNLWYNLIYNVGEDNSSTTSPTYFTNYRSDVCTNISIFKYDDSGNLINTYTLINAMPILLAPIEYSWNLRNMFSKMRIRFNYTNYSIN